MANITYLVQKSAANPFIVARLQHGRKIDYKRKTHYRVSPKSWTGTKTRHSAQCKNSKEINDYLEDLKKHIETVFDTDYTKGKLINGQWLENQIKAFHGQQNEETDGDIIYFDSFAKKFIKQAKRDGKAARTVSFYTNIANKVKDFEKAYSIALKLVDLNKSFENRFKDYLLNVEKLAYDNVGRMMPAIKTIALAAEALEIPIHAHAKKIKGFRAPKKNRVPVIYLTLEEIDKIRAHSFQHDYLENVKDWLLIGCDIGQRVSDLLNLTAANIMNGNIEFIQEKTSEKIVLPLDSPLFSDVKEILDKRGGNFPRKISEQRFNDYLKEVCKRAGIDDLTLGTKRDPKSNRKGEPTLHPKHELISSHTLRRSFCTNNYGRPDMPTPLVMFISGHRTERIFLEYVGKKDQDTLQRLMSIDKLRPTTPLMQINKTA